MPDLEATIMAVVAETFGVDVAAVSRHTVAADIDGWDSLSHTILMLRLEKRLRIRIDEKIAIKAGSVGALIDIISSGMRSQEEA